MPRGRPSGSKNKKKPSSDVAKNFQRLTRDPKPKKTCPTCQKEKSLPNFYKSFNQDLHKDGYLPYCKNCLVDMSIDPETHGIDFERFQNVLRQCDRPWDEDALMGSVRECERDYNSELDTEEKSRIVITKYWKTVQSLPQYRMSWQEYEDKKRIQSVGIDKKVAEVQEVIQHKNSNGYDAPVYLEDFDDDDGFELTKEIVRKFGQGYTKSEYKAMVEKYDFLSQSYPDLTNLHTEALVTYTRYKVKEEFATSAGNVDEAEKWAALATKAADKAKINPSQLSQSDLQGGLNSFSELMMAIEQAVDIIPILPQFKFRPNDAVDFTIWCYVNYIRKAEGKPLCEYEDIYHFYDERKAEYIAQYGDPMGIFKDDPTEKNRDNVKRFITLPKDYSDEDGK